MYTLNCKGKLLVLEQPVVMGIINATHDSFYKADLPGGEAAIVTLADTMLKDGAAILDVGGQSTKPGSSRVDAAEEIARVLPVIKAIMRAHPDVIISIDTYHSTVATAAVEAGASIVNDISGGEMDRNMITTVGILQVPYICTHMQGEPGTMQAAPAYHNLILEISDFFIAKIMECRSAGIHDMIIDPGFGFGKSMAHNFHLLKHLSALSILEKPLLAGLSRKGTIYKTLGTTAAEALNGTTVLNSIALMNGANILRVHDVKEACEAVKLFMAYQSS